MIPKVIHYCWFGEGELSDLAKKYIDSWKKHCPDYEIKRWSEKDINIDEYEYMRETYDARAWGFVPDVARLMIILKEGGIYFDTDVEIKKSFDPLLDNHCFMGFEDSKFVNLGQGFGAEPNNPVIQAMLDVYKDRHFRKPDGSFDRTPSPYIQTETLKELGMHSGNTLQKLKDATIYPSDYFCPISFETGKCKITNNTYSVHHFDGSWMDEYQVKMINLRRKVLSQYRKPLGRIVWEYLRVYNRLKKDGIKGSFKFFLKRIKHE